MKFVCVVALSVVAALLSATAYGQQESIPKEVLDDLAYNVGDWTTKVEFGKQVTEGKWSAKWSAEGKCLILHMSGVTLDKEGKGGGEKTFATGLVGWDGPNQAIKELVFWSDGSVYDARYFKKSPTTWEGDAKGVVEGKEFTEKVSITRNGESQFVWKAFEYVLGGEKQPDITTAFSKVSPNDITVNREKLAEAFGWLLGDWETTLGEWHMTFSFYLDVDETVVVLRGKGESATTKWSFDCRNYWDRVDKIIKNVNFIGPFGVANSGVVTEAAKNRIAWVSTVVHDDGKSEQDETCFFLKDDRILVFQTFGLLDDGTKQKKWEIEFTKK